MYDEVLAEKIREKRQYREETDGTVFCTLRDCAGSTGLRCYKTGVPICQRCAVRTSVGYISREANREHQDKFYDAQTSDYLMAAGAAFFANLIIGFLVTRILWVLPGFFGWIILFFLASSAAGVISEIIWRALRKRRGRYTARVIAGALVVSSFGLILFTPLIGWLIYTFIVVSGVSGRFQMGIRV